MHAHLLAKRLLKLAANLILRERILTLLRSNSKGLYIDYLCQQLNVPFTPINNELHVLERNNEVAYFADTNGDLIYLAMQEKAALQIRNEALRTIAVNMLRYAPINYKNDPHLLVAVDEALEHNKDADVYDTFMCWLHEVLVIIAHALEIEGHTEVSRSINDAISDDFDEMTHLLDQIDLSVLPKGRGIRRFIVTLRFYSSLNIEQITVDVCDMLRTKTNLWPKVVEAFHKIVRENA